MSACACACTWVFMCAWGGGVVVGVYVGMGVDLDLCKCIRTIYMHLNPPHKNTNIPPHMQLFTLLLRQVRGHIVYF